MLIKPASLISAWPVTKKDIRSAWLTAFVHRTKSVRVSWCSNRSFREISAKTVQIVQVLAGTTFANS
jgi:hypothetical protein